MGPSGEVLKALGDPSHLHRWERLELSCCISLQRLTDPAKGIGCNHRARQDPSMSFSHTLLLPNAI